MVLSFKGQLYDFFCECRTAPLEGTSIDYKKRDSYLVEWWLFKEKGPGYVGINEFYDDEVLGLIEEAIKVGISSSLRPDMTNTTKVKINFSRLPLDFYNY